MAADRPRFHLAFPVHDLQAARQFYGERLGCAEGRSSAEWVDFNFFGHQIVAHLAADGDAALPNNEVDGEAIPVRHFGVILGLEEWRALAERLERTGTPFRIPPTGRFAGQSGEQSTFFIDDPSGNVLEFKAFADDAAVFAR